MSISLRHGWSPIGLDIGSQAIRAVQVTRSPRAQVRVQAVLDAPRSKPGAELDGAECARIAALLDRRGFRGNRVVVCAPARETVSAHLDLPARGAGVPLEQLARMEMARAGKSDPASFEMAVWDVPAPARAVQGTHMLAVACPRDRIREILEALQSGGLEAIAMDARSLAQVRAVGASGFGGHGGAAAILEFGWTSGLLTLVTAGVVVYKRSLAEAGLSRLHAALCEKLRIDPAVGAHLIRGVELRATPGERRRTLEAMGRAARSVAEFVDALVGEIQLSLSYVSHRYGSVATGPDGMVAKLLLAGGSAGMPGLAERMAFGLEMQVQPITPADVVAVRPGLLQQASTPALITALGLAMHPGAATQ